MLTYAEERLNMPELVKKCPECGGINLNWNKERGEIICRADLRYTKDKKGLICVKEGHKYPIRQGIPVLLPEEGKKK